MSLYDIINVLKKDNIIYDDLTIENIHTKYSGITNYLNELYRIDIILLPYESYYSGLLYFTGSKEFNIKIRSKAKILGYKLNEYGLYKNKK
jgi:DNA polymerase/3'-5' exonuclease PolX